ncbi:Pr6Pr family membrane protein [Candidatus Saccharibacteria bacterium]|jgi:hypothetical protein|nr:Pr6Pr family membrane protein [Candidatus Saccharibacteria bacterium]
MTIQKRNFFIGYKLLFALLGFSAIVTEIAVLVERGTFEAYNFFSYFTIQTNLIVFGTLLCSALALAAKREDRLAPLRSAAVVYMTVVGIGFWWFLSGQTDPPLTAVPWDNTVLHYIMPVFLLVDTIIDRPKPRQSLRNAYLWLLYPLAYLAYAMTRGAMTGWYPYPFVNPANGGYGVVAINLGGMILLAAIVTLVVNKWSKKS